MQNLKLCIRGVEVAATTAPNQQLYDTLHLQAVLHTSQLFGLGPQLLPNTTVRSCCLGRADTVHRRHGSPDKA